MKFSQQLLTILCFIAPVWSKVSKQRAPGCEVLKRVTLSFYGKSDAPDRIAYSECGRLSAGGTGSFDNPLTMASAPGIFTKCEVIFVPYLLKYVRYEDVCSDCVKDFAKDRLHMQVWTGTERSGGKEQSQCERDLAPTYGMAIIRHPGPDYRLDSTPLYSKGATNACRLDHRYSLLNNDVFCYGRKNKKVKNVAEKSKSSAEQSAGDNWGLVEDTNVEDDAASKPDSTWRLTSDSGIKASKQDQYKSDSGWSLVEDSTAGNHEQSSSDEGWSLVEDPASVGKSDQPKPSAEWSLVQDPPSSRKHDQSISNAEWGLVEGAAASKKQSKPKSDVGWSLVEDTTTVDELKQPISNAGWSLVEDSPAVSKLGNVNSSPSQVVGQGWNVVGDSPALRMPVDLNIDQPSVAAEPSKEGQGRKVIEGAAPNTKQDLYNIDRQSLHSQQVVIDAAAY